MINIWADHVSLYEPEVGGFAPHVPTENTWAEHVLEKVTKDLDDHDYDHMKPFNWTHLLEAFKEKRCVVFWTCENLTKLLQQNARDHQLTCKPHWAGPERCS